MADDTQDTRPPLDSFVKTDKPPLSSFVQKPMQGEAPVKMGMGGQFLTGLEDIPHGVRQLYSHLFQNPETAQKVDTQMKVREADIAARGGRGVAGAFGNVVAGLPVAAAVAPFTGELTGAALGGILLGAAQPTTNDNYGKAKAEDMVLGGALGAGAHTAIKALSAVLGPQLDAAQKWAISKGIQLTPGQIFGGVARRAEEAFRSRPILGSFIANAEGRTTQGFRTAIYNQSMEPLQGIPGVQPKLPDGLDGRSAFKATKDQFDKAYDVTLQNMRVRPDHDFGQDISDLRVDAQKLPPKAASNFYSDLTDKLTPVFNGQSTVKDAQRSLRTLEERYRGSPDTDSQRIADMFADARSALSRAISRQNPQMANQLQKIDLGYAMFSRARDAAIRAKGGDFTPAQLTSAIRPSKLMGAAARNRFAGGDDLLQLYADYGQKVIGKNMPDSGTPERIMFNTAVNHFLSHPVQSTAELAAALPYTRAGMGAIDAYMGTVGSGGQLGAAVRPMARYLGPGIGSAIQRQEQEKPTPYGGPQQ